jgi:GNAT superfamily N-acetyltransferase
VKLAGPVALRLATADDARAIAEVHVSSWRWAYRGHLPESTLEGLDVSELEGQWRSVLEEPGRIVLVATDRDDVVGFAHAAATDDEDSGEDIGQLYSLYLLQRVVGAGLGRALLERATEEMLDAGFAAARLWVLESNERARRFYERAGWSWDGTQSAHQMQCANLPILRYSRRL